jgi:hypothetical protein
MASSLLDYAHILSFLEYSGSATTEFLWVMKGTIAVMTRVEAMQYSLGLTVIVEYTVLERFSTYYLQCLLKFNRSCIY